MKNIKFIIMCLILIVIHCMLSYSKVQSKKTYDWSFIDGYSYLHEDDENKSFCTDLRKYFESFPSYIVGVNRKKNTVTIFGEDYKGEYTIPVVSFLVSCSHDTTPIGVFSLKNERYKWRKMIDGSYAKYATRIVGQILFHSIPYEEEDDNTLIKKDYEGLGTLESAGCIRLRACDANWIYKNLPEGTAIFIYDDDIPGPFGIPKVDLTLKPGVNYDPTDPELKK